MWTFIHYLRTWLHEIILAKDISLKSIKQLIEKRWFKAWVDMLKLPAYPDYLYRCRFNVRWILKNRIKFCYHNENKVAEKYTCEKIIVILAYIWSYYMINFSNSFTFNDENIKWLKTNILRPSGGFEHVMLAATTVNSELCLFWWMLTNNQGRLRPWTMFNSIGKG